MQWKRRNGRNNPHKDPIFLHLKAPRRCTKEKRADPFVCRYVVLLGSILWNTKPLGTKAWVLLAAVKGGKNWFNPCGKFLSPKWPIGTFFVKGFAIFSKLFRCMGGKNDTHNVFLVQGNVLVCESHESYVNPLWVHCEALWVLVRPLAIKGFSFNFLKREGPHSGFTRDSHKIRGTHRASQWTHKGFT